MKRLALAAIRGYQRFLSPLKGFSCAFRVATGADSCSSYGYRVIARFGVRRGVGLLERRLALCGHVHRRMPPRAVLTRLRRQQGFCDACDACDGPCDCIGAVLDVLSCGADVRDCWSPRKEQPGRTDHAQMDTIAARARAQQARRRRALRADGERTSE